MLQLLLLQLLQSLSRELTEESEDWQLSRELMEELSEVLVIL